MEQPGSHGSMEGKLERALLGEIDRARSRERKRINTGENLKPISGAVVDAINNLCDATQPEALKRQLVDRVMRERWKDFHPAIAGRCADAVLDGGITKKQFRDFIKEANDVGRNPGAYFQSKCRKECESAPNPVPWRDGKSKGRASE